jgi:hypothetical protein
VRAETEDRTQGEPGARSTEHGPWNPQPGTRNSELGTRNPERDLPNLALALRSSLEKLDAQVSSLLEAVEAEGAGLLQVDDDAFAQAQEAKQAALEGTTQARGDVLGVLRQLESAQGCEPGAITVASLPKFAPQEDWTYVQALGESISAKLEAAQAKSGTNVGMVRVRLDYFDFLTKLILKTWESATGCSASSGDSVSMIVDEKA